MEHWSTNESHSPRAAVPQHGAAAPAGGSRRLTPGSDSSAEAILPLKWAQHAVFFLGGEGVQAVPVRASKKKLNDPSSDGSCLWLVKL